MSKLMEKVYLHARSGNIGTEAYWKEVFEGQGETLGENWMSTKPFLLDIDVWFFNKQTGKAQLRK